ncbi:MAG: hypothetical protein ACRELY_02945 [Polyangiaceae bacterium]
MRFVNVSRCFAATLAFFVATSAHAQSEDARANARALAEKGDTAFATGRCDRAIPLWKEADAAFAAPSIELRIAHCQALLGHVVDAATTLESIAQRPLPPDAPDAFKSAQAQAVSELPTVRARVATLELEPPAGVAITRITVDEVDLDAKKTKFQIDPGRHAVRVAAGNATWDGPVQIEDGEHRVIPIRTILEPGPEPSHALRNVGFLVGGVGLAALGVGTVLGIAALDQGKALDDDCGPSRSACPASDNDRISRVKTFSTLTDVFLASGIVFVAAGGFLVLRDLRTDKALGKVRLVVGASGVGLSGAF